MVYRNNNKVKIKVSRVNKEIKIINKFNKLKNNNNNKIFVII